MTESHGGELVVDALARHGVRTVFGLTGGHVHPIMDAMLETDMRLIDMRHEAAVVHAADAYARVAGHPGVAIVTAGPGVANAVSGLATAYHACSPVVLLAGSAPVHRTDMGALQEADEVRMVSTVAKWARRVLDVRRLPEYLHSAFHAARSGRPGPALLVLPQDVLTSRSTPDPEVHERLLLRGPAPDAHVVEKAAELLRAALRPLIIVGAGARWSPTGAAGLHRLAQATGIPVLGKGLGRGVVAEDYEVGFPYEVARTAVPEADVVALFGARLNYTLNFGLPPRFAPDVQFIQVDVSPEEIGRNRAVAVPIFGDSGATAGALADAFEHTPRTSGERGWFETNITRRLERLDSVGRTESGPIHPLQLARAIDRRLPADRIIVGDGANVLNWIRAVLRVSQPGGWLDHAPFGAMGVGIPFGIGARAASEELARAAGTTPRSVAVFTGDGAFGFYPIELATAARHHLPFLTLVANDGGWGADRDTQITRFGRNTGVDFGTGRYDEMAGALDCWGASAATPAELEAALDVALQQPTPAVVNAIIDPSASQERRRDPLLEFQLERSENR
jgi:acetolactate synthase-1/2/3 large subunit